MKIAKDQTFLINSFNLGFINVLPTDILIKVEHADYGTDHLVLSAVPIPGAPPEKTYMLIERWFQTTYPTLDKEKCLLKSPLKFQTFISSPAAGAQLWPR